MFISSSQFIEALAWARHLPDGELDERESLPRDTIRQLMEIYPDARKHAIKAVKADIQAVKKDISELADFREAWQQVINVTHFKKQPGVIAYVNEAEANYRARYEAELKRLQFDLHFLTGAERDDAVVPDDAITDDMIARAKAYPIKDIIKVNRAHKAVCPWHDDRNPSLHVYHDHVYCFVEGRAGDSIDVYMSLNKCDFKTAVKALSV